MHSTSNFQLFILSITRHLQINEKKKNMPVLKCLVNTNLMPPRMPGLRIFCVFRSFNIAFKRHSSSRRWQTRQLRDRYTREAAVQGLKSRAAFKLLQVTFPIYIHIYITHSSRRNCADNCFTHSIRLTKSIGFSGVVRL